MNSSKREVILSTKNYIFRKKDKHLNLFYSFAQGKDNSLKNIGVLEDNITRSFLITLSNLGKNGRRNFFKNLLNMDVKKEIFYDLQNIDNIDLLKQIQKIEEKILLIISSRKTNITKESFSKVGFSKYETLIKINNESKGAVITALCDHYKKGRNENFNEQYEINGISIPNEDLISLYELMHGCRPDGWIFSKNFAILIESKIGNNAMNEYQLFRHLVDKKGFSINQKDILTGKLCDKYKLISLSWKEVLDNLVDLDRDNIFVKEFKEYLIMCGEILSFEELFNGLDNSLENQIRQLRKLVEEMERRNIIKEMELTKSRKAIVRHPWQQFGDNKDLHFGVYVEKNEISVDFSFRGSTKSRLSNNIDNWNFFVEHLWESFFIDSNNNPDIAHRYSIYISEYHIFDHYLGLQTGGENRSEFSYEFNGNWLNRYIKNKQDYDMFMNEHIKWLFNNSLQVGIKYRIPFPDWDELKRRRNLKKPRKKYEIDLETLSYPSKCVDLFCDFISKMKPLYNLLK